MNPKTKILIGAFIVGLLIVGWWMLGNQNTLPQNRKCNFLPDSESYESYAFSKYAYELHDDYVTVSGNLRVGDGSFVSGTNLTVGGEFYLPSGEEQIVTVKLERIENNKAYFKFEYGAAPPACKDTVSCDYGCDFVIEK